MFRLLLTYVLSRFESPKLNNVWRAFVSGLMLTSAHNPAVFAVADVCWV